MGPVSYQSAESLILRSLLCVYFLGGSFRHFLWQVVRELQSSVLPILIPCPSGAAGVNKVRIVEYCPHYKESQLFTLSLSSSQGKYLLAPGEMTYSEEKLLQFFGQVGACFPLVILLFPVHYHKSVRLLLGGDQGMRLCSCVLREFVCLSIC